MVTKASKRLKRERRHRRVRAKIKGSVKVPRLCIFRSNKHIYSQLIDDNKGETLIGASDTEIKNLKSQISKIKTTSQKSKLEDKEEKDRTGKAKLAYEVGQLIAKKALEKKIKKIVFDRGGYKYHGRVKALAEGARAAGLKF